MATHTIHVADHDIEVSKLDKEFYPDDHVSKSGRGDRIFLDINRNAYGQTSW